MKKFLIILVVVSLAFEVVAIGNNIKYGGTLKVVTTWGPVSFNLNPLLPQGESLGVIPEIYETLFYVNTLNGKITPVLGTNYKWEDNNLKLVVTTRTGVDWTDGTTFSANDVAFTFNYIKKYPALDTQGIWSKLSNLESVAVTGPNEVTFTFSKPNTTLFTYISNVYIIPEHIWTKVDKPVTYINPDPVGTGPFLYKTFDAQNYVIQLVKNPNYWMAGRPYINAIEVHSLTGTQPLLWLLRHEADWSYYGSGINPKKMWADKDPAVNKFWWPVSNVNALYLNTVKYPFNNIDFRKAVSMAIDKNACEQKAYFGIGGVANPTGVIPSQWSKWFDPTLKALAASYDYNPQKAEALLASAGFKKNSAGRLMGPDGKVLPTFKILVGAGWGDYITQAQIIQQNLKAVGIETSIDQEPWSTYISTVMSGTYDTVICWGTGSGPTPYYLYYQEFNPAFTSSKIGEQAVSGYSRYTNPLITAALGVYSETSDVNLQKQAMYTIERIVLQDVPFIPLTNRTNFEEFSEANFIGWPSESNPYCAGGNIDVPDGRMIVLNIHLK